KVDDEVVTTEATEGRPAVTGHVSMLKVGAAGVNAFFGVGGPYWDANRDGKIDAADVPLRAGAIGLAISNASFGLALMTPKTGAPITETLVGSTTPVQMTALKIGASHVDVFVGINGPRATNPGAIGISLLDTDFALAILKPTSGPAGRSYYALRAHAASVGVVGLGSGFEFTVTDLTVLVNGSSDNTPVVDFSLHPLTIQTGPPPHEGDDPPSQ